MYTNPQGRPRNTTHTCNIKIGIIKNYNLCLSILPDGKILFSSELPPCAISAARDSPYSIADTVNSGTRQAILQNIVLECNTGKFQ